MDSAGSVETVTIYIGPLQYQGTQTLSESNSGIPADTLQFFRDPEGRVRVEAYTTARVSLPSYEFDYFLKDHLGDTRMVLTDEQETDMYPAATMEMGDSNVENVYYMNLDSTRSKLPLGYPTDTTTNPNNYVAKVSSDGTVPAIGPAMVLKVMAGDQFNVRVSSWYRLNGVTPETPVTLPLTDLLTSLIAGVSGVPNMDGVTQSTLQSNTSALTSNVLQFLHDTTGQVTHTKPAAFVNSILSDNQFNYVAASSGFSQVESEQEPLITTLTNLPITSSGYLYIYISNATPNVDVFFDNLQVTHTRGPLLEEDCYYPFGLAMAGISDKAVKTNYAENKYRFNGGNELQNKEFSDGTGLEMYDASARNFDPQLGRFWQMDGLADQANQESFSPYHFAFDDPVRYGDHDGKCPTCVLGAIVGGVVDIVAQVGEGLAEGKSLSDAVGSIKPLEVGVAVLAGFVSSGISAIYSGAGAAGGALVAGSEMALSKPAASAIAGAAISVMNQANDAANNDEPLTISPVTIAKDIATDNLADHIADKAPEIHFNNTEVSKQVNEGVKDATGAVVSKSLDMGVEYSKPATPAAQFVPAGFSAIVPPKAPAPDATAHPQPIAIKPIIKGQ
jgi:RHS repeat-associated protein